MSRSRLQRRILKKSGKHIPVTGQSRPKFPAPKLKPLAHYIRQAVVPASLLLSSTTAFAGPAGENVTAGNANVNRPDANTTVINQHSTNVAIDWSNFNINKNELVQFNQPSSSAQALNRIIDQNPTQIFGSLRANGHVLLLNPNGVFFGPTASVNVGALTAASMDMKVDDFMNGNYNFQIPLDSEGGMVVNQGIMSAATGGSINLVGEAVSNEGLIYANAGSVNLIAGKKVTMDFDGDGLIQFAIDESVLENVHDLDAAVSNTGEITAEGGAVLLQGSAAKDIFTNVVNNQGIIKAGSIENVGGKIRLIAGSASNSLINTGTLDVSGTDSDGGTVQIEATGKTTISGNSVITGYSRDAKGGLIAIRSNEISVQDNATLDVSGSTAGGTIEIESTDTTIVSGESVITASSDEGRGGEVQILGDKVGLLDLSAIDASGLIGGGTVLVGGDFQGINPEILNADVIYVGEEVSIQADAVSEGDGGKVILWADNTTRYYGDITAKGGSESGDGGFVEVSGKGYLDFNGTVNTTAENGEIGTLLLDPTDVFIADSLGNAQVHAGAGGNMGASTDTSADSSGNPFTPDGTTDNSLLLVATLEAALTTNDVIVNAVAGGSGAGTGKIVLVDALDFGGVDLAADRSLTINAKDIYIDAQIDATGETGGDHVLDVVLDASTLNGGGIVDINAAINTNGGTFSANAVTNINIGANVTTTAATQAYTGAVNIDTATPTLTALSHSFSSTINLNANTLTLDNTGTTTISTAISGVGGGLTKKGSGQVTLSVANSYSGATTINAGVIRLTGTGTLGTTAGATSVTATGAALEFNTIGTGDLLNITGTGISDGGALKNDNGTNTLSGGVNLTGAATIGSVSGTLVISTGNVTGSGQNLTAYGPVTINSSIATGTGTVTVKGGSFLTLTGSNSYTGQTNITESGALRISNGNAISDSGAVVMANTTFAQFLLDDSETIGSLAGGGTAGVKVTSGASTATLTIAGAANTEFAGVLTNDAGTLSLTKTGSGTLNLSGANSYTGATTVNDGVLQISHETGLGTTAGGVSVASAATLDINGVAVGVEALTLAGALTGTGTASYAGGITLDTGATVGGDGDLTLSGIIADGTLTALTKSGLGTLTLSGTNTYTGATAINAGVINAQNNMAFGDTAGGVTVADGAAVRLSSDITVSVETLDLSGSGISGTGALVGNAGSSTTWSGAITLSADTTIGIDGAAGTTSLTTGTIDGGGFALTVDGYSNGMGATMGTYTIGGAITNTESVDIFDAQAVNINAAISTNGDTVGDVVIAAGAGGISSTAPGTITTTAAANSGDISGDVDLSTTSTGTISLLAAITTTGADSNVSDGAASDGGNVTISTNAGTISVVEITASGGSGTPDGTIDVDGGDSGDISITAGGNNTLGIGGAITALGGLAADGTNTNISPLNGVNGDLTLSSGGSAVTQSAAILAGGLELLGSGAVTLTQASNNIDVIAGNVTNTITYVDADGFAVDSISGQDSLTSNNNINLTATTGNIMVSAGASNSAEMLVTSGSGAITLTATSGNVVLDDFAIKIVDGALSINAGNNISAVNSTANTEIDAFGNVTLIADSIGSVSNAIHIEGDAGGDRSLLVYANETGSVDTVNIDVSTDQFNLITLRMADADDTVDIGLAGADVIDVNSLSSTSTLINQASMDVNGAAFTYELLEAGSNVQIASGGSVAITAGGDVVIRAADNIIVGDTGDNFVETAIDADGGTFNVSLIADADLSGLGGSASNNVGAITLGDTGFRDEILMADGNLHMSAATGVGTSGLGRITVKGTFDNTFGLAAATTTSGGVFVGNINTGNISVTSLTTGSVTTNGLQSSDALELENSAGNITIIDIAGTANDVYATGKIRLDAFGTLTIASGADVETSVGAGSAIDLIANDMDLSGTVTAAMADAEVLLKAKTGSTAINLGGSGGGLELSAAELNAIAADILRIGDSSTNAAVTLTGAWTPGSTVGDTRLEIETSSTVTATAAALNMGTSTGDLVVRAGGAVNLGTVSHDFNTVAVTTGATASAVTIKDGVDGMTIGSVDGINGVVTGGAQIDISTAGALSVQQNINNTGAFNINLTGVGIDVDTTTGGAHNVTIQTDSTGNLNIDAGAGTLTLQDEGTTEIALLTTIGTGNISINAADIVIETNDAGNQDQIVSGGTLTITSNGGTIGLGNDAVTAVSALELNDVEMDSLSSTGTLTIGNGASGRILLDRATTYGANDLKLVTGSFITDNSDANAFTSAGTLTLTSNGTVGIDNTDGNNTALTLGIDVNALTITGTGANNINVTDAGTSNTVYTIATGGAGNVVVTQTANNLNVGLVSTLGNVDLTTTNTTGGAIIDNGADNTVDIFGGTVTLTSNTGIGSSTADQDIETSATNLVASTTTSGDIVIDETDTQTAPLMWMRVVR